MDRRAKYIANASTLEAVGVVRSLPLGEANCPKPGILGDIPKTRTLDLTWVFEVRARVQIPSAPTIQSRM